MKAPPKSKLFMFADDGVIISDHIVNVHKVLRGSEMQDKLGAIVSEKMKDCLGKPVKASD